jgi:hypothetical protein
MRRGVILFLVSCFALPAAAQDAPYRCEFGERVSFQDVPCGRARHTSSVLYDKNGMRIPGAVDDHAAGRSSLGATPPRGNSNRPAPRQIDFGVDQFTRLNRASAVVSSILIEGRECEWDLKVTKKYTPCAEFIALLEEGGDWTQAARVLSDLLSDKAFAEEHKMRYGTVVREMKEVVRIKEFAVARMLR